MIDLRRLTTVLLGLLMSGLFLDVSGQTVELYVGTYTSADGSKGVQIYDFEKNEGVSNFSGTIPMDNPSFLARKGKMLYAVNENNVGTLTAIDLENRTVVGTLPTKGAHPCHVAISPSQPVLVVSNYSSGSLTLFSLKNNGEMDREEDFIQFKGSSINKERQSASHVHSAFFSIDGTRLFVSDLGADLIYVYEIEKSGKGYSFKRIDSIQAPKGTGPRHVVISDDAKCLYVVLELTGELAVFQEKSGEWVNVQMLPIYEKGFEGEHGAADVKVSADGRFVYATNRGDANVIVCYEVLEDQKLRVKSVVSAGGISPRNLNISTDGNWLFVTNQLSNQVAVFKRNILTGALELDESASITVGKPVCLIF